MLTTLPVALDQQWRGHRASSHLDTSICSEDVDRRCKVTPQPVSMGTETQWCRKSYSLAEKSHQEKLLQVGRSNDDTHFPFCIYGIIYGIIYGQAQCSSVASGFSSGQRTPKTSDPAQQEDEPVMLTHVSAAQIGGWGDASCYKLYRK